MRRTLSALAVLFLLLAGTVAAQWLDYKRPGVPRTPEGKPKLDAPAPKALDGKPDLSGVWMHEKTSVAEMRRLYRTFRRGSHQGGRAGHGDRHAAQVRASTSCWTSSPRTPRCGPRRRRSSSVARPAPSAGFVHAATVPGFPLAGLLSEPIKIVQAPRLTIVLYEAGGTHRQIFTDGRTLPREFDLPAFLGYSAGHWERDTLVVETAGFNDKTPLDVVGHPHSDSLRVDRALPPPRLRPPGRRDDVRRSQDVHAAVHHQRPARPSAPTPTSSRCSRRTRRTAPTWGRSRWFAPCQLELSSPVWRVWRLRRR